MSKTKYAKASPSKAVSVNTSVLSQELAAPAAEGVRAIYNTLMSTGWTPQRIGAVLLSSEGVQDYTGEFYLLAEAIEERDPQIRSALQTRKLAVAALPQEVDNASDSRADKYIGDFVRDILSREAYEDIIMHLMDGPWKGLAVAEIVYDTEGALWVPSDIIPCPANWFMYDRLDGRTLLLRDNAGSFTGTPLPFGKFLVAQPRLKSGLAKRAGIARTAAIYWYLKQFGVETWSQYAERYGMPLAMGTYPTGTPKEDIAELKKAVSMLSRNGAAVLRDNMKIIFQESSGKSSDIFEGICNYCDAQNTKLILGQTSTTDIGKFGTKGLGEVHDEVRGDIMHADARMLTITIQRFINALVTINFGADAVPPKLRFQIEEKEDITAFATAAGQLIDRGLKMGQSYARRVLGVPDPQEGEDLLSPATKVSVTTPSEVPDSVEGEDTSLDADQEPEVAAQRQLPCPIHEPHAAGALSQDLIDHMADSFAGEFTKTSKSARDFLLEAVKHANPTSIDMILHALEQSVKQAPNADLTRAIALARTKVKLAGILGAEL